MTEVVVYKGKRRLNLLSGTMVLKSYDIRLGSEPTGHKQFDGDGKTPEGLYYLDRFNPRSSYHLSVGISYPNDRDKARAAALGRTAGEDIMIHGRGPDGNRLAPRNRDWTVGCITVTDEEIEDIQSGGRAQPQPGRGTFSIDHGQALRSRFGLRSVGSGPVSAPLFAATAAQSKDTGSSPVFPHRKGAPEGRDEACSRRGRAASHAARGLTGHAGKAKLTRQHLPGECRSGASR